MSHACRITKQPHTFPDIRDAANALAAYVGEWSGFCQYELRAVMGSPDRAIIGYHVRVMDIDSFGVGYLAPVA